MGEAALSEMTQVAATSSQDAAVRQLGRPVDRLRQTVTAELGGGQR
jgi:hypothetical protein